MQILNIKSGFAGVLWTVLSHGALAYFVMGHIKIIYTH